MESQLSPLRTDRRLTPELFDYYVARARVARAEAIAKFGSAVMAWLFGAVRRMARRPMQFAGTETDDRREQREPAGQERASDCRGAATLARNH